MSNSNNKSKNPRRYNKREKFLFAFITNFYFKLGYFLLYKN